jgi:hypothetical protein
VCRSCQTLGLAGSTRLPALSEFKAMHLLPSFTRHRSPSKALVRAVSHTTVHPRTGEMQSAATLARTGARRAEHVRMIEIPFQSATALQALPRVNVDQFVGAGAVAPARSTRSGHNHAVSNVQVRFLPLPASFSAAAPRPNPSVNRTSTSGLRPLAAAPHVNR